MLKFRLGDWMVLKNIFSNINEIIDEIVIECNYDGLKFNALDRSHVCFFECELSKELFDEYELSEVFQLYIDLNDLVNVLKRGNSKDIMIFEANMETFNIIFKNKNKRSFQITQVDIHDNSKNMPKLDYSVTFKCDFDMIKNTLKDAELYSDRLEFNCEDNHLILRCEGGFGKYENKCQLDNTVIKCSSTYGIDYLFKVFNNKLNSNDLKISMGEEYPMLIEMISEYVKVNYLIAPRIENDG